MKRILLFAAALALYGCRGCDPGTQRVKPIINVTPTSLDFLQVKVGASATLPVTIESQAKAELSITAARIEGASAANFKLADVPATVPQLSSSKLSVTFTPTDYAGYGAVLVIDSNDEDHPRVEVSLSGEGGKPIIKVEPECEVARKCTGTVVKTPPMSIDFGTEPVQRQLDPDPTTLPDVHVINEGQVDLVVTRLEITGADKAAFKFRANATLPAGGKILTPSEGFTLPIQLTPTSEAQLTYAAVLEIESDDPDAPLIKIALKGAKRDNLPPVVCANITKVDQGDTTVSQYGAKTDWDLLLTPPPGGYDFSLTREVQPNSNVYFSAWSDAVDVTKCSTDPEDGRTAVTYLWEVVSVPTGAATPLITSPTLAATNMRVGALTGEYVIRLTVKDVQNHATSVTLKFVVAIRQDLVAQVSWLGYPGVDLDVHLVRPSSQTVTTDPFSGVFSFFEEAPTGKTSGDVNGWSANYKRSNTSVDFEWGDIGTQDDPRLNLDEQGSGPLVENVSMNYPEHDPKCANGTCTYKVLVHYFKDARGTLPDGGTAGPCLVDGAVCKDGQRCNCADPNARCVANDAPPNAAPTGTGKCFIPPQPVVKVFVKSNPTPAAVIPLDTLAPPDRLELAAPCQVLYVADVVWPQRSDAGIDAGAVRVVVKGQGDGGYVTAPVYQRYGVRSNGGLSCSPNATKAGQPWYAPAP